MKLKKAMMIRYMSPMLTAGVTFAGPKGRRSKVVKLIAGERACGTAARFARGIVVFCKSALVQVAPNWDVTAISSVVSCGTT